MGLTFGELTETPVGPMCFFAGDGGLQRVAFCTLQQLKAEGSIQESIPSLTGLEVVGALLAEFNAYFFGIQKVFSVKIDWHSLGEFQRQVLALTANIPYGQFLSYKEVASQLGRPGAARAVGNALANNPMPIVIPCHRVVGSDRRLTGYIGGTKTKAFLLELEGHLVDQGKIKVR